MLKVAIVGCGKIADDHVAQILRIKGCEIVGVCDREPLMAKQLYERFPIKAHFSDLDSLLSVASPDVVHITTSPETHFNLARICLEAGCHAYVEKPFTLYAEETRQLIALATRKNLKITVGHDDQFTHVARRMRSLITNGYLGGSPVHVESSYCYELERTGYAGALLGDKNHWIRRMPGKLLQNVISHGIARIAEFINTDSPEVIAHGFVSPMLKSMGETEIIDELRVIVSDEDRMTAYFTFSSQMRPSLHEFRAYGSRNGLILDHDQQTLIKLRGVRFKSYVEKFAPPFIFAKQYLENVGTNLRTFLANDFQMKSGMKYLMESFYKSITGEAAVPIPYREIVLSAVIMEEIFKQLERRQDRAPSPSIAIR